jgi:hypothetical protein
VGSIAESPSNPYSTVGNQKLSEVLSMEIIGIYRRNSILPLSVTQQMPTNGQLTTVVGVDRSEYLPQVGNNIQVWAASHPFDEGIPPDNSCSIDA